MSKDITRLGVLIEHMDSKIDLIVEVIGSMQEYMKTLAKQEDLERMNEELSTTRIALRETNRDVQNHEIRISTLETEVFSS